MKKQILSAAFCASAFLFFSCNGNNPQPTNGVMTCNINGNSWASTMATAAMQNNIINVTGQITNTGQTITLVLQGGQAKSYTLSAGGSHAGAYTVDQSGSPAYTSNSTGGSGSVTVEEIDSTAKTITGIFNFIGVRALSGAAVQITDGKFTQIPYVEQVNQTFNNTFTADVNGTGFNPTLIAGYTALGKISIVGSENGSFPSIGLSIPDDITAGTYTLSAFGSYQGLYNVSNGQNDMYSAQSSGSVTISSHNSTNKQIEGTFVFLAEPNFGSSSTAQFDITNGTFAIEY